MFNHHFQSSSFCQVNWTQTFGGWWDGGSKEKQQRMNPCCLLLSIQIASWMLLTIKLNYKKI